MLPEISLNILDVVQNSITANASLIEIVVAEDPELNQLTVEINDNGKGMDEETIRSVIDPFYTTRTTRKVGLGVPFLKMEAECTGGYFDIQSEPGVGTREKAVFMTDHIDCMPLGDINSTIHTLVTMNHTVDFLYQRRVGEKSFVLDTREFREILGDVPFYVNDVSMFIRQYLDENELEVRKAYI